MSQVETDLSGHIFFTLNSIPLLSEEIRIFVSKIFDN